MYVVIVGAGKVGWNLARELIEKGHEVTVLEQDRRRYLTVEQELEHAVQYGDATELWVLERAGIQRADLVVAVTGDDEDNLLICQVAKEKYLCERIIARVNNPRNLDHFKLLGIQPAVSATDLILRLIEHEVPRYGLVHLLDLPEERLEIIELVVGDGCVADGKRVSDLTLPDGALIISVQPADLPGRQGEVPLRADHRPCQQPAEPRALQAPRHPARGLGHRPDPAPDRARGPALRPRPPARPARGAARDHRARGVRGRARGGRARARSRARGRDHRPVRQWRPAGALMPEKNVDILIVGGGLAGASCAEGLREAGFEGSVLLAGREPHPPYQRPPCSQDRLRGGSGFVPKADTVVEAGDEVLVVLDPGLEDAITAQFVNGDQPS